MGTTTTTQRKGGKSRQPAKPSGLSVPPTAHGVLSKDQIAGLLSISVSMLKIMIAEDQYPQPTTYFGNRPRWHVEVHNAWLAKRCGLTTPEG